MGTLDRDVRLTPTQIALLTDLARRRRRELRKKIDRAQENARGGQTIQHGTLDRHITESNDLTLIIDDLEVAREQIVRKMKNQLGVTS